MNMNSSANKQMRGFAYFDKYYAVRTLKLNVLCTSLIDVKGYLAR